MNLKKLALCGILTSAAMVLSYIERLFPLELLVPVPGIKLGLANIITLFSLFYLGFGASVAIVLVRCFLTALLFGNFSSFAFSITGAILALFIMFALKPLYNKKITIYGISIAGAAAHNIGQLIAAAILLSSTAIFAYLTVLLFVGIVTGSLISFIAGSVFKYIDKIRTE